MAAFSLCCADFEPEAWIALGNLMARRRTPGFAARVLQNHTLHRTLRVWDDDDEHPPPRKPCDGIPYDAFHRVPDGYPPTVVYRLRLEGRHENGERQVSWHRGVSPDRKLGFGGVTGTWPEPGPVREGWLRWLVGPGDEQPPSGEGHHDVKHVGRQPWDRDLRTWIERLHEHHWRFLAALLDRGAVHPGEIPYLLPRVEVEVQDGRSDRRGPLPPLPSVPPSVPRWLEQRLREMAVRDPRATR